MRHALIPFVNEQCGRNILQKQKKSLTPEEVLSGVVKVIYKAPIETVSSMLPAGVEPGELLLSRQGNDDDDEGGEVDVVVCLEEDAAHELAGKLEDQFNLPQGAICQATMDGELQWGTVNDAVEAVTDALLAQGVLIEEV